MADLYENHHAPPPNEPDLYALDRRRTESALRKISAANQATARRYIEDGRLLGPNGGNKPSTLCQKAHALLLIDRGINGKAYDQVGEEDLRSVLRDFESRNMSPQYREYHKTRMRAFFRWLFDDAPPRFVVKLLKNRLQNGNTPGRIIEPHEVQKVLDATESLRDQAIVALLYSSGLRAHELLALNWGSIKPTKTGALRLELPKNAQKLKTGPRYLFLTEKLGVIRAWLTAHPQAGQGEAPLRGSYPSEGDAPFQRDIKPTPESLDFVRVGWQRRKDGRRRSKLSQPDHPRPYVDQYADPNCQKRLPYGAHRMLRFGWLANGAAGRFHGRPSPSRTKGWRGEPDQPPQAVAPNVHPARRGAARRFTVRAQRLRRRRRPTIPPNASIVAAVQNEDPGTSVVFCETTFVPSGASEMIPALAFDVTTLCCTTLPRTGHER
jgi:integrase